MENALMEQLFGARGRGLQLPRSHDQRPGAEIHRGNRTSIRLVEWGSHGLCVEKQLLRFCNVEEERFGLAREAEVQNAFPHPSIVPVLDYADDRLHRPYIRGLTLAELLDWIEPQDLTVNQELVFAWLRQLARLLHSLHQGPLDSAEPDQRPIIHRDLTPGNLYLDDSASLLLSDFGLARRASDLPLVENERLQGTPNFLPPELHDLSRDLTPASDVFQMTLLAACLVSPRLYRKRKNTLPSIAAETRRDATSTWHQSARTALGGYSFREGLNPEPSARPTAAEFLKLLEHPIDA